MSASRRAVSASFGLALVFAGVVGEGARAQQASPEARPAESADLPRAREAFRLATQLYEAGRFRQASDEFERAYELSGEPSLLHNVYVALRDLGDARGSADALRRYLAAGAPGAEPGQRGLLQHRLEALEASLASASEEPPVEDDPPLVETPLVTPPDEAPHDEPMALSEAPPRVEPEEQRSGSKAWVWALVAVLVGAAVITTAVALGTRGGDYVEGDVLGRVETLGWSW